MTMTREDYEQQKRRLAEQHQSLLEMLNSAHQLQLRALDMVWRMISPEPPLDPTLPPAAAPPQPAPPPAPRRRQRPGELYADVLAALPKLTDPFIQADVCRAIGYAPDRSSLYRTLQELKELGHLVIHSSGLGTQATHYRKAGAETVEASS